MKKEKPEEVALPTVSKVILEKVHEKQSEMAKKKASSQSAKQRSARLKFVKKYESLTMERAGMIKKISFL